MGDPPAFVIVGGVNGSGKSTFAAKAAGTDLLLRQTAINPDTLSQQAEAEAKRRGLDLGNHGANIVGVERAEKAAWKAVAEHRSAALETVLSTDKLVPLVRAASAREFRTRLVFVALPTVDLCIERVEVRVRQGGHAVPADRIRKRWQRPTMTSFAFSTLWMMFWYSPTSTLLFRRLCSSVLVLMA